MRQWYLLTIRRSGNEFDSYIATSARWLFCPSALQIRDSDRNRKWQEADSIAAPRRVRERRALVAARHATRALT
jgi:hypothetical protein